MKISTIRTEVVAGNIEVAKLFVGAVIAAVTEHTFDEEEDPLAVEPIAEYLARYGVEVDRNDLSKRDYRCLLNGHNALLSDIEEPPNDSEF